MTFILNQDEPSPESLRLEGSPTKDLLSIEKRISEQIIDEDVAHDLRRRVRQIERLESTRTLSAYAIASAFDNIITEEIWKKAGCESVRDFVRDYSPCRYSSTYKYIKVGSFIRRLDIQSDEFEEDFYENYSVPRIIVEDDFGHLDELATRQANRIVSRCRYSDMEAIAGLHDKNLIDTAEVPGLIAKAIVLEEDEFKKALREAKGEENPLTPDEILFDNGFDTQGLVLPLRANYTRSDVINELEAMLQSAKAGLLDHPIEDVRLRHAKSVTSKKTQFIVVDGFRFIAT